MKNRPKTLPPRAHVRNLMRARKRQMRKLLPLLRELSTQIEEAKPC